MDLIYEDIEYTSNDLKAQLLSLMKEDNSMNITLSDLKKQIASFEEVESRLKQDIYVRATNEKEITKLHDEIQQLKLNTDDLSRAYNLDLKSKEDEILSLQDNVSKYKYSDTVSCLLNTTNSDDEIFKANLQLECDINDLQQLISQKEIELHNIQQNNLESTKTLHTLQSQLSCLNDFLANVKEKCIKMRDGLESLEDELVILKSDLHNTKLHQFEIQQDSIFAEVNDRRLIEKRNVIDLETQIQKINSKMQEIQKFICFNQVHCRNLENIITNNSLKVVGDYNRLTLIYTTAHKIFKNLYNTYKRLLFEKNQLIESGLPNNTVEFLNKFVEDKNDLKQHLVGIFNTQYGSRKMLQLELKDVLLLVEEHQTNVLKLKEEILMYENKKEDSSVKYLTSSPKKLKTVTKNVKEQPLDNEEIKRKVVDKKVTFTCDTKDDKPSGNHRLRRGAKLLQHQVIYFD